VEAAAAEPVDVANAPRRRGRPPGRRNRQPLHTRADTHERRRLRLRRVEATLDELDRMRDANRMQMVRHRAAETAEQRAAIVSTRRAQRRVQQQERDARVEEEARAVDSAMGADLPTPQPQAVIDSIVGRMQDLLWGDYMERGVCCVCDMFYKIVELNGNAGGVAVEVADAKHGPLLAKMQARLKVPADVELDALLLSQYDVSDRVPALKGCLISPRGVTLGPHCILNLCVTCHMSLRRGGVEDLNASPPKARSAATRSWHVCSCACAGTRCAHAACAVVYCEWTLHWPTAGRLAHCHVD